MGNKAIKGDNFADLLKQAEQEQKNKIDMNLSPIRHAVRASGNGYNVYMESNTHEVLAATLPNREQADAVAKTLDARAEQKPTKVSIEPKRGKCSSSVMQQIQAVALNLDPARRVRFRETMVAINYLIHMLTDTIDENSELFDMMFDAEAKTRVKTINKQLDRLLDNIYTARVMGDADDYTNVAKAAYGLRERFEMYVNYVVADDWRFNELEKTLSNVLPDAYIASRRAEVADSIAMQAVDGVQIVEKLKK